MGFTGTVDKCKACEKTVYFNDLLTADGVPYHKTCFRCSQCNGKLQVGRFSMADGMLFCMPHFEQRFKELGSYSKNPHIVTKSETPNKHSSIFSGTIDKCATCKKTVYPLEKIVVDTENYHKSCFKCAKGGCSLSPSNYAALDGIIYCKPHFAQLFKEKGSYNHLKESVSGKKDENSSTSVDEDDSEATPEPEVENVTPVDEENAETTPEHEEAKEEEE